MENNNQSLNRRLKLFFDATVFKESDDFPLKTLVLVPSSVKNVGDLCYHLITKFDLKKECPNGISLSVEGFSVPPTQDISIVRENDVITVHKRVTQESKKRASIESPKEKQQVKKPKTATTAVVKRSVPAKPTAKTLGTSSSSSDSSVSGGGYSSESETSEEEEDTPSEQKVVVPAKKPVVIPRKTATPAPRKPVESSSESDESDTSSSSEEEIVSKTVAKKSTTPITPAKKVLTPTKPIQNQATNVETVKTPTKVETAKTPTKVKFDENGDSAAVTPTAQIVTPSSDKPKRKRNKKNKQQKTPLEDVQKNTSVILTNRTKPERNYASFPLLTATQMPKVGDHVAFNMVELIGWQPTVSLKEAAVLEVDKNTITVKIDDAFMTQQKSSEEDENIEEMPEEMTLTRDQMLDVRVLQ